MLPLLPVPSTQEAYCLRTTWEHFGNLSVPRVVRALLVELDGDRIENGTFARTEMRTD